MIIYVIIYHIRNNKNYNIDMSIKYNTIISTVYLQLYLQLYQLSARQKEKRKEYTIYNKSSNNKEITNQLSGGKQKRKGMLYNYSIYYRENNYIERKRNTI